jgi:hypothetical protein
MRPRYFLEWSGGIWFVCDAQRRPRKYVHQTANKRAAMSMLQRLNSKEAPIGET